MIFIRVDLHIYMLMWPVIEIKTKHSHKHLTFIRLQNFGGAFTCGTDRRQRLLVERANDWHAER